MEKQKNGYVKKEMMENKINNIRRYYEERLKERPSTIQIIALGISCFALGVSLSRLIIK